MRRYFILTVSLWVLMGLVVAWLELSSKMSAIRWIFLGGIWVAVLALLWAGWSRLGSLAEQLEMARDELHLVNDRIEEKAVETGAEIAGLNEKVSQSGGDIEALRDKLQGESGERERMKKECARLSLQLEEKGREMENFMLLLAHELRSPLINIQGFCIRLGKLNKRMSEMVCQPDVPLTTREMAGRMTGDEIPRSLNYIESGVNRMNTLLTGLHNLAITWNQPVLLQPLDMNHLVSGLVSSMKYQLQHVGAEIQAEVMPLCLGDREQMGIVLSNILENAVKYRDPQRRLKIRISGWEKDGKALFEISDTGSGISEELQKTIWDFGGATSPDGSMPVAGHGLALVKRIVDRLDGRIWLESEVGRGSKFFIELPGYAGGEDGGG
jgi:signal transduction histidine kinase